MDKFIEYAPIIIVVMGFFTAYKVFVTPQQLNETLKDFETKLDNKFVHKDVYEVETKNLNNAMADIKEKIDKIYDKVMGIA